MGGGQASDRRQCLPAVDRHANGQWSVAAADAIGQFCDHPRCPSRPAGRGREEAASQQQLSDASPVHPSVRRLYDLVLGNVTSMSRHSLAIITL